jgi:hypothetical protein
MLGDRCHRGLVEFGVLVGVVADWEDVTRL